MSAPAHEQIRNLLARYCECLDNGDFAGAGALFAKAVLRGVDGRVAANGSEEAERLWTGFVQMHGGAPRTRHLSNNPIIEVDEAAGTAKCRSVYTVFQATTALPFQPILTGRYYDTFERGDGDEWHFTSRQYFVDLVGNMTAHQKRTEF